MNWTENEFILCYGYFMEHGNKPSGEAFLKNIEIFRKEQNRSVTSSINTFKLRVMNIEAWKMNKTKLTGGLERSKLFKNLQENLGHQGMMNKYSELTQNLEDIQVATEIKEYKKVANTTSLEEIDVNLLNRDDYLKQKASVEYKSKTIAEYLRSVRNNEFSVPLFQRKFVWTKKQIIDFLNSLNKGFPFGTMTIWQEKSSDGTILEERNEIVTNYKTTKNKDVHDTYNWILDGQQRTTCIIATISGDGGGRKTKNIIYSFSSAGFKVQEKTDNNYIFAKDLLNEDFSTLDLKNKYNIELDDAVLITDKIRKNILNLPVGITWVKKANINTAIDIFTEMNTKGKRLSLFDIIHAKWQSKEIDRNLEQIVSEWNDKSQLYKPEPLTVVKSLYLTFDKTNIKSKDIMTYEITSSILEKIEESKKSFNLGRDFLLNDMKFKPELMPSSNLIRILTYAFSHNENKQFNAKQNENLKKYIKYICMENFYSSSTDQKVKKNISDIEKIIAGEDINNIISKTDISQEEIIKLSYNEGSSKYLYILNRLFKKGKSLANGSEIPVYSSDSTTSKINIHHIVPKSLFFDGEQVKKMKGGNSLANLAPIREDENQEIKNKFPAIYYSEFKEKNNDLDHILGEMLIPSEYIKDIKKTTNSVTLNNFWNNRAESIAQLINAE